MKHVKFRGKFGRCTQSFDYLQMFVRFNMWGGRGKDRYSVFVFLLPSGNIRTEVGCHRFYTIEWSVRKLEAQQ